MKLFMLGTNTIIKQGDFDIGITQRFVDLRSKYTLLNILDGPEPWMATSLILASRLIAPGTEYLLLNLLIFD